MDMPQDQYHLSAAFFSWYLEKPFCIDYQNCYSLAYYFVSLYAGFPDTLLYRKD